MNQPARSRTATSLPAEPPPADPRPAVLALNEISLVTDGVSILDGVDWLVRSDQRWIVIGPNGSGKTTLIRLAALWLHPSSGSVEVLGESLGRTDIRRLRRRVGFASAAMADLLRHNLAAIDAVMTAKNAALEPWWHSYDRSDRLRAQAALERVGCAGLASRRFGDLSSGERQRVLLARAMFVDPGVILLDEPNAGLDLAGREELVRTLADLALDATTPPIVLVTHHVEEIPEGFSHVLLLRQGRILAQGPLDETLSSETLSSCFGIAVTLERQFGRWTARAV